MKKHCKNKNETFAYIFARHGRPIFSRPLCHLLKLGERPDAALHVGYSKQTFEVKHFDRNEKYTCPRMVY